MLQRFFDLMETDSNIAACLELFQKKGCFSIYGVGGSVKTALTAKAIAGRNQSVLIVVPSKEQMNDWIIDLRFFAPERVVMEYPYVDKTVFTTTAKSMDRAARLTEILSFLRRDEPVIVLATGVEASQFVVSPAILDASAVDVVVNHEYNRETFLKNLTEGGYERVDMVERRGHFSVRGDIIDVFAVNHEQPLRIEFFGDEIDSIRIFDSYSQKSIGQLTHVHILPYLICESAGNDTATIFDYCANVPVVWDEPNRIRDAIKRILDESDEYKGRLCSWHKLAVNQKAPTQLLLSLLSQSVPEMAVDQAASFMAKTMASFQKQFTLLIDEVRHWQKTGQTIFFVVGSKQKAASLNSFLKQEEIGAVQISTAADVKEKGIFIVDGELHNGFELPYAKVVVLAERDVYGMQKHRLRHHVAKGQEINSFTDLKAGDYVVHEIHGIGKYLGIKTIELEGVHKDYLEIHYSGKDILYVPTEQVNLLQRYIGNEGETPKLHKMGGTDWQKTRSKAQKSITDLAEKLVAIYAQREVVPGYAYPADTPWQKEFEDAFPYEETEDQLKAVADIKKSMEKPYPMDCLVCGDVGFGKTEVALRAIFKAVMGGKQVAVLVPTTVLAQQHYQTFTERFRNFGVTCDVLNRFRSAKEKKDILTRSMTGNLDVLIGTHSLLSKKVRFKDLGLLVVDEEQRFGVTQKEKWKAWASAIDVLTLSATPIPRTLHMSLVSLREMCVIETPPTDRFPVQTYVTEYDIRLVRDAVMREKRRGGQVFFVYNRVATIERMKDELQALLPEINIGIAHGQMTGTMLESIMFDFYEGTYDMLVCSSLIENGLDVANANTIIVYDADHFGLSQLYQMRGRVGRSHRMAYAYFLYRRDKVLSEVAERRLQAIKEFTELGSGFKIAMRDLEIRGAGNLLGREQHGNIASVGFAMYCRMLEEAIAAAKNHQLVTKPLPETVLDINVDAFIDANYIENGGQKIEMYQRLAMVHNTADLKALREELIDRYGTPTDPVEALLQVAQVRVLAQQAGLVNVIEKKDWLELKWGHVEDMPPLARLEPKLRTRFRTVPDSAVTLRAVLQYIPDVLSFLNYLLKAFIAVKAEKGEQS